MRWIKIGPLKIRVEFFLQELIIITVTFTSEILLDLSHTESNEEKRVKCLQLLDFCAEHPQLCNNRIFTDFFSNVETPSPNDETDRASNNVEIRQNVDRNNAENSYGDINTIYKLSKEGQILEAAAMSTDLV